MRPASTITCLLLTPCLALADWPQWRGPDRNGVAAESASLPNEITEANAPTEVWRSVDIPSDHYGGHGSVSVADGAVFLSVVWHEDKPTETRQISGRILGDLGYRGLNHWDPALIEKFEADRMGLSRRMRGSALEEWAKQWTEDNLDEKERIKLGGWAISRFKQGKSAIPLQVFDVLKKNEKTVFEGQSAMEAWVEAQAFSPDVAKRIIDAVPATEKIATDVVIALSAETGEQLWKYEHPGEPTGRNSSSTPAVKDGVVYAILSTHLYAIDTKTGEALWVTPISGKKGPASSPLVVDEKVFVQLNPLTAFDAKTGETLWTNKEVSATNSSPAFWNSLVICNSAKEVIGIDAATGETRWKAPGGGDGTPVVSGDTMVISSRTEDANLIAYQLQDDAPPEKLWSQEFLARRYGSSPIILDGYVYHLGSERHLCLDQQTGEIAWEREAQSSISSPIMANEKLLVYENRGGFLNMIKADPENYTSLGRAKVSALYCASPALVGKRLYFRTQDTVVCYEFGGE